MATFATVTELKAYVEGWTPTAPVDDTTLERYLVRAERDVNAHLRTLTFDTATGLRVAPASDLEAWQRAALSRAVCAQAYYRWLRGEEWMGSAQYDRVRGPEFTTDGTLPYLSPQAARELLTGGGLAIPGTGGLQSVPLITPGRPGCESVRGN